MSEKFHEIINENELTDVVKLENKDGNVLNFYHIGTIEYKDDWYAFFQPAEQTEGVDPDEIVIFKLDTDEKGEVLVPVKDKQLLDEVYDEFMKELEEEDFCSGNCEGCHGCDGND